MRIWGAYVFLLALLASCFLATSSAEPRVSVTEVRFDSAVDDVQWLGKDNKIVLLKTVGGRLYRSDQGGREWNEITANLRKALSRNSPSTEIVVNEIKVSPVNKNYVLAAGTRHHHFISEDAGRTWRHIETQQKTPMHSWLWHPTRAEWALFSLWSEGCEDDITSPEEKPCDHELFYTKDLGRNWRSVERYVVQFSWGDKSTNSEDKIFYTHHREKFADQPRSGWSSAVDFASMSLPSHKVKTLVLQGNKFLVSNGYIFVARLTNALSQAVDLFVSTDGGQTFEDSILPFELIERSYTILDTSGKSVMIHVNHGDSSGNTVSRGSMSNVGNVYVADEKGLRFALSLPNNIRTASGECEFDKVASMEGVYIANYKEVQPKVESNEVAKTAVDDRKMRRKYEDIRTVITFDKGGIWNYLTPPRVDSTGKPYECVLLQEQNAKEGEKCWLHLHGVANFHNYAPFYSVENAVGLIMGTGNVGPYLRSDPSETNTYLSRDGGLTWKEVHKGAFIYEFGDHGGLIVMADDIRKTNLVIFSWDEGELWYDFNLGEQLIEVDNIVVEPNSAAIEFLLYGTRGDAGVLYHLDFSTMKQPECKGTWAADSVSSDYETWSPSASKTGEQCLLGRQVTYTRRKRSATCFHGKEFDRQVVKKNCVCTKADYECEFGFSRAIGSTECRPDNPRLFEHERCHSDGYRRIMAYRKVPGNSCEDGYVPEVSLIPCSNPELTVFGMIWRAIMWTALLVIGAFLIKTVCLDALLQQGGDHHHHHAVGDPSGRSGAGDLSSKLTGLLSVVLNGVRKLPVVGKYVARSSLFQPSSIYEYSQFRQATAASGSSAGHAQNEFVFDKEEEDEDGTGFGGGFDVVQGAIPLNDDDDDEDDFGTGPSIIGNLDTFGSSALASRVRGGGNLISTASPSRGAAAELPRLNPPGAAATGENNNNNNNVIGHHGLILDESFD